MILIILQRKLITTYIAVVVIRISKHDSLFGSLCLKLCRTFTIVA